MARFGPEELGALVGEQGRAPAVESLRIPKVI